MDRKKISKHSKINPSAWVKKWAHLINRKGKILDLACGNGRHLRYLLGRDQIIVGIDIDLSALVSLRNETNIELHCLDLEKKDTSLPDLEYAGIIVTNYLHRPLLNALPDYLSNQGVLIYETFAIGNEMYGRPSNPDFLLRKNELNEQYSDSLDIIAFEEKFIDTPNPAVIQRICAVKSD